MFDCFPPSTSSLHSAFPADVRPKPGSPGSASPTTGLHTCTRHIETKKGSSPPPPQPQAPLLRCLPHPTPVPSMNSLASSIVVTGPSVPGTTGTPSLMASSRAEVLSPARVVRPWEVCVRREGFVFFPEKFGRLQIREEGKDEGLWFCGMSEGVGEGLERFWRSPTPYCTTPLEKSQAHASYWSEHGGGVGREGSFEQVSLRGRTIKGGVQPENRSIHM